MRRISLLFSALVFCSLVSSCRKDDVEVYRVPKTIDAANPAPGIAAMSRHREVSWKIPPGWQEQAPSQMRLGSFLIQGRNDQTAEVSIVSLAGEAGGELANINRWRQQIALPPLSESEANHEIQVVDFTGRKMKLVNFVSTTNVIDGKFKKRVIAAVYLYRGQSWFFKLAGDDVTVQKSQDDFMTFLKGLEFHDHE
jgi:hypothetical protein